MQIIERLKRYNNLFICSQSIMPHRDKSKLSKLDKIISIRGKNC